MRKVGDYILLKEIGMGMFSRVFLCKNTRTSELFACKQMRRLGMSKRSIKNLQDETTILKNINSPYVV